MPSSSGWAGRFPKRCRPFRPVASGPQVRRLLLGTWLGIKAHHLVPERAFFLITYVLLTVTGLKLISDALT